VNTEHAGGPTRDGYASSVVDGCRRGERSALELVFRAEAPYLERVLFRVLGPSADLEDMLQSTLEQAIRAFPAFRGEASVRTWLTRIAVRSALHHLKSPALRRRVSLELIEGGLSAASRPADEVEARARLRVLYEHLAKLDAKQRTAFVLFQIEERSMEEVAALMDSGLSATKSRVMWARRKLLARLSKDPRAHGLVAALRTPGTQS
jgi:RNA polymerase sigma-70 factor, ECF subfamily